MKPLGLTQYRLARDLCVTPIRISQIVNGKRSISVDTAMRLAHYFGTSAAVWVRLQVRYDLEVAEQELGNPPSCNMLAVCLDIHRSDFSWAAGDGIGTGNKIHIKHCTIIFIVPT
jgi:addiction module HigA family antidote